MKMTISEILEKVNKDTDPYELSESLGFSRNFLHNKLKQFGYHRENKKYVFVLENGEEPLHEEIDFGNLKKGQDNSKNEVLISNNAQPLYYLHKSIIELEIKNSTRKTYLVQDELIPILKKMKEQSTLKVGNIVSLAIYELAIKYGFIQNDLQNK